LHGQGIATRSSPVRSDKNRRQAFDFFEKAGKKLAIHLAQQQARGVAGYRKMGCWEKLHWERQFCSKKA
jgi:hypothetical protein